MTKSLRFVREQFFIHRISIRVGSTPYGLRMGRRMLAEGRPSSRLEQPVPVSSSARLLKMLLFQVVRVFQTLPRSKQWRSDASQSAVAVSEQEKGQARPHYLDPLRQFLDSGSDPPIDLVSEEPALLGPGNDASTRFGNFLLFNNQRMPFPPSFLPMEGDWIKERSWERKPARKTAFLRRFCQKVLRPVMPHPQEFTFQRAFILQHLKYATKSKGYAQSRHSIASAINRYGKRASQDFHKKAGLARGLLSTKADLLTGFGKAYLDYSKTMDWFSYSSIPGEKESQLLLQIFIASSSDLRVRLGDIFFLAQSLSPDLDSTGKILFAMRPCKEGSLISITASLLCTRYLVAIPRKGPLPTLGIKTDKEPIGPSKERKSQKGRSGQLGVLETIPSVSLLRKHEVKEVTAVIPPKARPTSPRADAVHLRRAAKTGYAESELRDARSRLSPSADSQATAKRTGDCPLRAHHLPERDWTVALSALESDSVEIGEMALPLFESEMIVTFLTAHSSFKPSTSS
ncbi:hypothetical protein QYF36_027194 [Acer negundo]|nr:hypothetical protein QYF36_027194 [Acer negundo]